MHVILINIWHLWLWFLLPCLLTVIEYRRRLSFHSRTSTQYLFSKLLHTTSQWESTQVGAPSCSLHGVSAIQIAIQRLMNTKTIGRHSRRSMVSSNSYFNFVWTKHGHEMSIWRIEKHNGPLSLGVIIIIMVYTLFSCQYPLRGQWGSHYIYTCIRVTGKWMKASI